MHDELLLSLTPVQSEAVRHVDGPLLILAGPGSGKTRVVTHRIAHMLRQGVPGRQILAVTFTNKAADEMRLRVRRLAPSDTVWIGTFHRYCARLLRRYAPLVGLTENFSIYDAEDSGKALRRAMSQEGLDTSHISPSQIAGEISRAKMCLIGPEQYQPPRDSAIGSAAARAYGAYQRMLLAANAMDFDDLLRHVAELLRDNPDLRSELDQRHRYIMVDEYQDTNQAQYAIVRGLSIDHPNLAVTGDPDQLIYGWRGATLHNILDFEKDYPQAKVVRLEQNYRSTKNILQVADHLIANNVHRKEKALFTDNSAGTRVRLVSYATAGEEADDIADQIASEIQRGRRRPRDFAVFYRINALSRSLEHALRKRSTPYQIVRGLEFYQRKEVKDVAAFLHLIHNPANDVAFERIVNIPPRGIGRVTLLRLAEHARRYGSSLLEAARESRLIETLSPRAASALEKFAQMYDRLVQRQDAPLEELLGHVLAETGYRDYLADSDSPEDAERAANIDELLTEAQEFDEQHPQGGALEAFLEGAALVSDADGWNTQNDQVTLMTLHAAKGLEFPVVYIVAIEEGLLPHERCRDDQHRLEEERRLLFVGITRAQEQLQLSMARARGRRGALWPTVASMFLMELPRRDMEVQEPPRAELRVTAPPPWEDDSPAPPVRAAATKPAKIMTAQQLLGDSPTPRQYPPELFHQGMLVTHPEYGPGAIVALSGQGVKRTATIRFFGAGQKKFRLAHSPLQPVKPPPP